MSAPEDLLERIRLRLDESFVGIGEAVADLPPADVADLVNLLTLQEAATVMTMLTVARAVEVFDQPSLQRRVTILEKLEPGRAGQILEGLSADERTSFVRLMGEHERRRLLPKLSAAVRAEVERLLLYPEHSAGGIMTTEFVRLSPAMTVGECLKHIRSVARETAADGVTANILVIRTLDDERSRAAQPNAKTAGWTTPEELASPASFTCIANAIVGPPTVESP